MEISNKWTDTPAENPEEEGNVGDTSVSTGFKTRRLVGVASRKQQNHKHSYLRCHGHASETWIPELTLRHST